MGWAGITLILGSLSSACSGQLIEDCVRGELDLRYCDRDGDLVADPSAEHLRLDPGVLVFAYTPVEDPAQFRGVWAGFLEHLERITERDVLFFPVQSNAAQIEAMRAGRLHVAGFNTGSVPLAVNCAGFHPLSMMARADGSFGYEMELLTHRDGVVVITGPTGSGKTTTLYGALRELADGKVNIMTVEDPIEYELPGITQTQVETKQGMTFAGALRAMDPRSLAIAISIGLACISSAKTATDVLYDVDLDDAAQREALVQDITNLVLYGLLPRDEEEAPS